MPNIKSAKKRVMVNAVKAAKNKADMTNLRTLLKKANQAIEANAADKQEAVKCAIVKLDKAAGKGLIHKNNAARKKSQLAARLNRA